MHKYQAGISRWRAVQQAAAKLKAVEEGGTEEMGGGEERANRKRLKNATIVTAVWREGGHTQTE